MNIQTRKLNLIENLILLQDETIISKMEKLLFTVGRKKEDISLTPMSLDAFFAKIDASDAALKDGRTISHKQLKNEIKKWKEK